MSAEQIDSGLPCPECSNITRHRDGCRTSNLVDRKLAPKNAYILELISALEQTQWAGMFDANGKTEVD